MNNITPDMQAHSMAMQEYENTRKKGLIMWLLWVFLGGFGAHRFYLGHTGYAIGMIIVTLLGGIGLIWALIDAFFINKAMRRENQKIWEPIGQRYGVAEVPESARP